MSSVVISGDSSGTVTLTVPSAAGTNTATLPAATGTVMVSGNMPAFSAYRQSSQSVTSNVFTKISLNLENFDTANAFDSTTNYRFTPQVAGYYQFNALISLSGTVSTQQFVCVIAKNGDVSNQRNFDFNPSATLSANSTINISASQLYYLNGSTDYVELYVYYFGGTSTISGAGGYQITSLSGSLVRTA
jgi:hypothetical protein